MAREFNDRQLESLEVLDGSRRKPSVDRAALRIEDLAALYQLPAGVGVEAAGATPTQAEFNKLVADVRALYTRLLAVSAAITLRRQ